MGYFQEQMMKRLEDIQKRAQEVSDAVTEEVGKEADQYAIDMVKDEANEEFQSAYARATALWYSAYPPKRYKRDYSLYDALEVQNEGNMSIGWIYKDEDMNKPSWGGGTYNIYDLVFWTGLHGGPVHGKWPMRSTRIPTLFNREIPAVRKKLQRSINEYGQKYFTEHFSERFYQKFKP